MHKTPYAEVDRLLDDLLSGMRSALSENLVGVYLYGSLTSGDFDIDISDLDLLAATASDVSETEAMALQFLHSDFVLKNPTWDNRVDADYLSVDGLKTFRSKRSQLARISPGEPFHVRDAGKDWLINWYVVRERGIALFGPPATTVIDPIAPQEYVQAVRAYIAAWGSPIQVRWTRRQQAYRILTICRALYTIVHGEAASKLQAASWAQDYLPEWSELIRSAVMWRTAWRETNVNHAATLAETIRFVQGMMARCAE